MTRSVRSAVEALRKTQGLPQQLRLFLPDPSSQDHACILPTASPHSAEGRRNRGHQRGNIPSPFSIMLLFMCLCLSLGVVGEKAIPFYPRDMGQKPYSPASNSKLINCNSQRFNPQCLTMRPSHRTSEMFRDRRTPRPSAWVLQDKVSPSYQNSCA